MVFVHFRCCLFHCIEIADHEVVRSIISAVVIMAVSSLLRVYRPMCVCVVMWGLVMRRVWHYTRDHHTRNIVGNDKCLVFLSIYVLLPFYYWRKISIRYRFQLSLPVLLSFSSPSRGGRVSSLGEGLVSAYLSCYLSLHPLGVGGSRA